MGRCLRWTRERVGLRCMLRCHAPRAIRPYNLATRPSAEVFAGETPSQGHSPEADGARFLSSAPRRRWRSRDGRPGHDFSRNRTQGTRSESRKARKASVLKKIASVTRRWRREPRGKRSPGFLNIFKNRIFFSKIENRRIGY